ncbi:MAG TPA: SusF/SusE family outer membrane protein [Hanamia sp.]
MKNISFSFNKKAKWKYAFSLLVLFSIINSSCKKPDYIQSNKGNAAVTLSAAKTSLVLKQKEDANDAVDFTWTTGSNRGTNASISYTLKIDKQGNNFSNPVTEELGLATLEKKYTVKDLNNLLLTHWNFPPDTEATLEAKIIANVSDNAAPPDSSSVMVIKVTPYLPVSSTLYLIGDATPNGWDNNLAVPLTASPTESGTFTWDGHLNTGNLKFITTLGQFLPSYNKGADNSHLVYRNENSQPDDQFVISTSGNYTITLNLIDLTVSITTSTVPPYQRLWMLGDAIPSGWNINSPDEMRVDSSNLFVFKYNEVLAVGEFKIPTATGNFTTDYYMPLTNHPALTSTDVQLVHNGSPDLKWQITNPGPYKITLDLQNATINIKPFTPYTQIWMVGDATPVGWNINSSQALTPDPSNPYIFTYTGPMLAGEFKFPLATGNWGCDYFMPEINHQDLGSQRVKFVPGGSPDNKWQITVPGNYKITLNQLKETIDIVKM